MELDNFEQDLFDNLKGYQSDQDLNLDQEWNDLEAKLPKKKDRRGFLFFWWGSGAIVIALIAGILLNNRNVEEIATTKSSSKFESSISETSKPIDKEEAPFETNKSNISKENTNNSKPENINAPNSNQELISSNFKSEVSSVQSKPNIVTSISNNVAIQTQDNVIEAPSNFVIKKESKIENDNSFLININENKLVKSTTQIRDSLPLTFLQLKPIVLLDDRFNPTLNLATQIVYKDFDAFWSVSASFIYGINKVDRSRSNMDNQDEIDFISTYENRKDYFGLDLKLTKNLNKHVSVFTGLRVSQHTLQFNLNEVFDIERISENEITEELHYLAGNVEYNYGSQNLQYNVSIESNLWQKYQSLAIPLGISVHTDKTKRWSVQTDFAFSISPFQNNTGRKVIRSGSDYSISNNQNYRTNIFFGLGHQLAINYRIAPNFSLQIQTDAGLDLSTRIKADHQYNLHFSHVGAGLGSKIMF